MSLFKYDKEVKEAGGARWEPGPFKFKITGAEMHRTENIMLTLQTWTDDGAAGPKVTEWLRIKPGYKDGAYAETARRLQTLIGKPEIDAVSELLGKTGYIVMRQGEKYLEVMPFGGFYTSDRKSATGTESMSERIAEAIAYAAPVSQQSAPATPATGNDEPF